MLTLTYQYKLQPTKQPIELIKQTLDVCRSVWNFALRQRKDWLNARKSPVNACPIQQEYRISVDEPFPGYHQQSKNLTQAKKSDERLRAVNAQVLQQVLRTLERAFSDMQARGFGFPRFKDKYQMRSYVYPQLGKDIVKGNQVKLPQLGWVRLRNSRDIPEGFTPKQARIVRRASGYFVLLSLQLDGDIPQPFPHGHPRGLDLGFAQFVEILEWVCWKRDVYFAKVNKDGTSQECSQCGAYTGKKTLDVRVYHCPEWGYLGSRDVVSAEVVQNRGLSAVGLIVDVKENACGDGLTGAKETLSSQVSQKQEILAVKSGISRHSV